MSEPDKIPRYAAIYARVSTDDKGQDPENQLTQLRRYCADQGYQATEYVDYESGRKADREQFSRMLEDAERGKFELLLVWKFDRFSREPMKRALGYLEQLEAAGVKFKSHTEPFLDTTQPFADVLFAIFAWMAEQEVKKLRERIKAGLERAKSQGKRLGRHPKHGDHNGEILERVARMHADGKNLRAIAEAVDLSRSRVCQLLLAGRLTETPPPPPTAV